MFEWNELFLSLTTGKKEDNDYEEKTKKKIGEIFENNHEQKISTLLIIII
jgi:hypothetical protein